MIIIKIRLKSVEESYNYPCPATRFCPEQSGSDIITYN